MTIKRLLLFGGAVGWRHQDWTDSDDRVRGGSSQSYLSCSKSQAEFYGTLNINTLGGAGFASQRTTGDDRQWDLSSYNGVELKIAKGDDKQYTFILKDEIFQPHPDNGREQSSISYEYEFKGSTASQRSDGSLFIPWEDFKATYRGKEKPDAPNLDIAKIKRMSLMMRSYFGTQEGDFSLTITSITTTTTPPNSILVDNRMTNQPFEEVGIDKEKELDKADNSSDAARKPDK